MIKRETYFYILNLYFRFHVHRNCEFCVPFTPRLTANVHLAERRGSKRDGGALERKTYSTRGRRKGKAAEKQVAGNGGRDGRGERTGRREE